MKKQIVRAIALALTVLMTVLLLSACGKKTGGNTVNINYQSSKKDMIVTSSDGIDCDYLLVYHSTAQYAEIDAYISLLEKLSLKVTSNTFQLCPDSLKIPENNQKIILLGETSYTESTDAESFLGEIRRNNYYDYLIQGHGNLITVNWVSKPGREDAFKYIVDTLSVNGFDSAFESNYSRLYLSSRSDAPVVTIGDINIAEYSVVMPTSPSFIERSAAENLVLAIKDATGIELKIVSDATDETTYEILIGNTNRGQSYVAEFYADNRFAVAQYGTKLILRGGQITSTACAVNLLTEKISNAQISAEPLHIKTGFYKTGDVDSYYSNTDDEYRLVFSEEFNTLSLNSKYWTAEKMGLPTINMTYYMLNFDPNNIDMNGKEISLTTNLSNHGYVSSAINTHNKVGIKYGYVEIRAKFRTAPSYWVKAGLTNQNDKGETVTQIDIFNSMYDPYRIFSTAGTLDRLDYYDNFLELNAPGYECYRETTLSDGQKIDQDVYHTYGVEWTDTYIRYFVDGVAYGTVEITDEKFESFNQELYLDLSATVEMFEQQPDDEAAQWPASYDIDWIRVYQKPNLGTLTVK